MAKTYNWAVLGCGKIAGKFSSDLKLLPNANLYAAASRDLSRAQSFADNFGYEKAYGSYKEMVADPNVDIVYVATPHSHHLESTLLCLNHKKAVLCEKAFAINSHQVQQMIDCSKQNNTFLMEAFWTNFIPSFRQALEIINSGDLGKLKIVRADFAFNANKDPEHRLYNLKLGGGSLLDIGIYPIFASLAILGKPVEINTLTNFSASGTEETIAMNFKYAGGEMASLISSFTCFSSTQAEFLCEHGYLRLERRWHNPTSITIWKEGDNEERTLPTIPSQGTGYQYEAAHVMKCLDENKTESDIMPLSLSLDLMEILDKVRQNAGIIFPEHD